MPVPECECNRVPAIFTTGGRSRIRAGIFDRGKSASRRLTHYRELRSFGFTSATRRITRFPRARAARVIRYEGRASDPVGPARRKLLRHHWLRFLLFPHGLFQLPRQHPLDCHRLNFLSDSLPFEEAIEG